MDLENLESKVGEADRDGIGRDPNKPWENCLGLDIMERDPGV